MYIAISRSYQLSLVRHVYIKKNITKSCTLFFTIITINVFYVYFFNASYAIKIVNRFSLKYYYKKKSKEQGLF